MKKWIVAFVMAFSLVVLSSDSVAENPKSVVIENGHLSFQDTSLQKQEPVVVAQNVVMDESMVPPEWLQKVILFVKEMPVVGPYAVKLFQWLGVLVSILTALCAFLLIALKSLQSVLTLAQLADLAAKIKAFENSKIMYWLKYLSAFNAPAKPEEKKNV